MLPNVYDAGAGECLTPDGMPVIQAGHGWGGGYSLVATRIRRGPQPLSAVLPGKDITSPAAWGF